MPFLYSPIDGHYLLDPVRSNPRSAFLMIHDNDRVSTVEARMQEITRAELASSGFIVSTASGVRRSGDFLSKIIGLIRGCGFGVAVFSDATPARTLANIFFEIGYCLALGKPTYLLVAGEEAAPSDFVRSEWILYESENEHLFVKALREAFNQVETHGKFLEDIALVAEIAEEIDPELAFERYKRAYLVSGRTQAMDGVDRIRIKVRAAQSDADVGRLLKSFRRRLSEDMTNFVGLCSPPPNGGL